MLVATQEALDRARVGTKFKVDGFEWERVEDGLRGPESQVLPLIAFQGLADAKKIRTFDDPGFTFPSWKRAPNDGWYLLLGEDPVSGAILAVTWDRYGTGFGVTWLPENQVIPLAGVRSYPNPDRDQMVLLFHGLATLLLPDHVFLGKSAGVGSSLLDDLHAMAEATPGLDEVLVKHNVGRMRTGKVKVKAEGTAKITPEQVGVGVEVEDTTVGWKIGYEYEATAPITDVCLCTTFDTAQYEARLPQNVVDHSAHYECTEKDCVNK